MNFIEAVKHCKNNGVVKRKSWDAFCGSLSAIEEKLGILAKHSSHGDKIIFYYVDIFGNEITKFNSAYSPSFEDIDADDWVTFNVVDPAELYTKHILDNSDSFNNIYHRIRD